MSKMAKREAARKRKAQQAKEAAKVKAEKRRKQELKQKLARAKDVADAEKRRQCEREREKKKIQELIEDLRKIDRKGRLGLPSVSPAPTPPRIRRQDVLIDEHTKLRKEPAQYRLEGDANWV